MSTTRRRHTQTGLSLMEVLVATLVFSVGTLGVAALQVSGMRFSKSAHSLSVSTLIAEDMADRMRANLAGLQGGDYDSTCVCSDDSCTGCDTSTCPTAGGTRACYATSCTTSSAIKAADVAAWKNQLCSVTPPGTSARITCNPCDTESPRTIQVSWTEAEDIYDEDNPGTPVRKTRNVRLVLHPISPHQ